MPTEIESIETGGGGLPEEALNITGNCDNRFWNGGWDWVIRDCGNKVITKDIISAEKMFGYSKVEEIPFELNFKANNSCKINNMFENCVNLKSIPKINNCQPINFMYFFQSCCNLRYLPDDIADWFDWTYINNAPNSSAGAMNSIFYYCCSLRSAPIDLLSHIGKNTSYGYGYFARGFYSCYCLDELVNLPLPYTSTWTSNAFGTSFNYTYRLKNLTFALQENGLPIEMNWRSQTIDLYNCIGYGISIADIIGHNSGITADKEVKDDATYQALKNDPDWFTTKYEYSRYNHDSAVATINSLPDTSAYLATAGGTNTIKFYGRSGELTDGGAINTLTEEEIAVAAAKGWTVSIS